MDSRTLIQAELDANERLLWSGPLLPARLAQQQKGFGCAAIFGAVFVVFWLFVVGSIGFGASAIGALSIFSIAPIGMFLFGLAMLFFLLYLSTTSARAAAQARDTAYAVTDKRLIVLIAGQGARSYASRDIERLERRDTPDGRGDVLFARERQADYVDGNHNYHERWKELGFFGIENARDVERLIRTELLKS